MCRSHSRHEIVPIRSLRCSIFALPDGTGFEILQALEEPRELQVIFLTAYDEYAVQAFDVAAIDYLLKPVSQQRFSDAIGRVRKRLAAPACPSLKQNLLAGSWLSGEGRLIFCRWT